MKTYKSFRELHGDLLEELQQKGDTFTQDQLMLMKNKLMEDYLLIKDICLQEHVDLIQRILLYIDKLLNINQG
jgi:hypothetical protein